MSIVKFAFEDELRGWKLTETAFGPFNLLVGASGVGKTRILKALERVRLAALKDARFAAGCKWAIEIDAGGARYLWAARTLKMNGSSEESIPYGDEDGFETEPARFAEEQLWLGGSRALVTRDSKQFMLQEKPLPKIKETESAISLLSAEDVVHPIYENFRKVVQGPAAILDEFYGYRSETWLPELEAKVRSPEELRDLMDLDILTKALVLQSKFPEVFARLTDQFRDIFNQVEEIRVKSYRDTVAHVKNSDAIVVLDRLIVVMRERGVGSWLVPRQLSSGMFRTFVHLLELMLAPNGTTFLIDEFENSLGVNCLPQVAEHILGRAGELQFIITSHHPYVINNIPASMWRVVTRQGSTVRVLGFEDLPALASASKHERFTILSNLPEFEHGIR